MSDFRRALAVLSAAVAIAAGLVGVAAPPAAATDRYGVPSTGQFLIEGHGFGHGIGMSQWGAYGAATQGLSYEQIAHFYYPHTTLGHAGFDKTIRVWLEGPTTAVMIAPRPKTKLSVHSPALSPHDCVLPHSLDGGKSHVSLWRAKVVSTSGGSRVRLQGTSDGASWDRLPSGRCGSDWSGAIDASLQFDDGGTVRLVRSVGGGSTAYRGDLRAAFTGFSLYGVNVVPLEDYTRSVIPREMSPSWSPAAVQAQAVASRTYGLHATTVPKSAYYDIYPDTRDQMYVGRSAESAGSDAAVKATETAKGGVVVRDAHGRPALTQFSASNGGWTVAGAYRYLPAKPDPYDGAVDSALNPHTWVKAVSDSTIESAFGSGLGSLESIVVTDRDGNGDWGGRVLAMKLRFTGGDVTVSPGTFCYRLGLLNPWFHSMAPPGRPDRVTAVRKGSSATVHWRPPVAPDRAPVTGYRVVLRPGGVVHHVGVSARSTSFDGLAPSTDYRVDVTATSQVGPGPTETVTTKVRRLAGATSAATAVAASRATFNPGKADAVILANADAASASYGAGPLARAAHAPVLLTGTDALPGHTADELKRVLPANRTVYLLGGKSQISGQVSHDITSMGYTTVRLAGASAAATAVDVAHRVGHLRTVKAGFEVSRDAAPETVWAATAAAARTGGVLLLTDGSQQDPATADWLSHHASLPSYAIGGAAQQADPHATAVASGPAAVAAKFFPTPALVGVAARSLPASGLAAAGRVAVRGGPVLAARGTAVPKPSRAYLAARRDSIGQVDLVGRSLPYDDVERGVQAALVG